MRATSQSMSKSNLGGASNYGGSRMSGVDDQNNSFELEDFDDVQEQILLNNLLDEKKRLVKAQEDKFRKSFLVEFFEQGEVKYGQSRSRG